MGGRNAKPKSKDEGRKEEKAISQKQEDVEPTSRPTAACVWSQSVIGRLKSSTENGENQTDSDFLSEESGQKTVFRNVKKDKIVVMAIDFGTTYTGYAYAFYNDPTQITGNYWDGTQIKTPTVVLLDERQQFHSFGREAKKKYMQLIKKGEHEKWYYFEHFKMKLFVQDGPLDSSIKLRDMTDKEMPAIEVFAVAIGYMKKHFLEMLHGKYEKKLIHTEDIHFILTVPAIWSDLSKQFMRKAAVRAGIPDDALTLALEPEAASIYCNQTLEEHVMMGMRYIVADLGGGTADFTCHEINPDNTLKELVKPSGGDFGGTTVDCAFRNLLNKLFGADILHKYKKTNMQEFYEIFDRFEAKKGYFDGKEKMILQFPVSLLDFYKKETDESTTETFQSSPFKDRVAFRKDKMFIGLDLAKELFDEAAHKIVDKVTDLLKEVNDIKALVLVGGFSESPYIKQKLKTKFDGKTVNGNTVLVISPNKPASAVIIGAVISGFQPKAIDSRVCKYTYGIGRMMRFKDYHPTNKRIVLDGVSWCDDLFNKHIEMGQTVRSDHDFPEEEYFPVTAGMKQGVLMIYASTERDPQFTDDPQCQLVGLIKLDLEGGDVNSKVLVKLIFGGTELIIKAREETTGNVTIGHVDFLG